jgi:hypothetical protein
MIAKDESLRDFIAGAHGYAVFPNIGKAGVGVGGASGRGVVYEEGRPVGYAQINQGSLGLQLGAQTYAELIVYNPLGGFVTGGGWLEGTRCNFGFNTKYKNGAPAGNFEFQNKDVNLKSTSIEQLVITAGKIAQFSGWAAVNGEAGNWFAVKAIDNGEPGNSSDTLEIRLWPSHAGQGSEPVKVAEGILGGGNISVHAR